MYYFRERERDATHSRGKLAQPEVFERRLQLRLRRLHNERRHIGILLGRLSNSECEIIAAGPFYQPPLPLSISLFQPSSTVYRPLVNHHLSATLRL